MKKLIFILALFTLSGCDLFTTRTPQAPVAPATNNSPAFDIPTLIANLKSSLEGKNLDNYMACIVDSTFLKKRFKYIAASGSVTQFPALANWSLEAEKQFFRTLITKANNSANSISLEITNQLTTQVGDSAVFQCDYSITLQASDPAISGSYIGTAQLKVFADSRNQWVIVQWEDSRKNNEQSWSDLKGRIY